MIVWGISANSHDASLCVMVNDDIVFASHAERFSGIKNDPHLNHDLIQYALRWGEPEKVVWYESPLFKTIRQWRAGQGLLLRENNIKKYLRSYGIKAPIKYVKHHESHAAAGYYTSGFSDATVLVLDSIGEFESFTLWEGQGDSLKKIYSQSYPHSLGLWYSAMTQRVGLKANEDEYILMGMAAYGDPKRLKERVKEFFTDLPNKTWPAFHTSVNLHRGCNWWMPDLKTEQDMFDIAAATQDLYEDIFSQIIQYILNKCKSKNLVLMGGCALNCVGNRYLDDYFDNVWIMPNPGDAGSSLGAILADKKKHVEWKGPYLGYNINKPYPIKNLLRELEQHRIVGVANGKAEFGPRALGNRSLFADPRGPDIKDRVNDIKKRQRFRPFAPVILQDHADKYFYGMKGPYMQYTSACRMEKDFPAITHVDGTSRVQTVNYKQHPQLYKLLKLWYKHTGCPMLLNTSLNIKGKPMVNTELDAKEFAKTYGVSVY